MSFSSMLLLGPLYAVPIKSRGLLLSAPRRDADCVSVSRGSHEAALFAR